MEAIYWGNSTGWSKGAGNGPWVMAVRQRDSNLKVGAASSELDSNLAVGATNAELDSNLAEGGTTDSRSPQ